MPRYNPPTKPDTRYRVGDYLNTAEVMAYLGVSLRSVRYMQARGLLAFEKNDLTGLVRFKFSLVEALRQERELAYRNSQVKHL